MNLTVTEAAAEKLSAIVAEQTKKDIDVRLFAQEGGGGCACSSGLRFGMAFDNAKAEDTRVSAGGLDFVVDPTSAAALEDAFIDWVENVMNQGFAITAPNAPKGATPDGESGGGACGCGGH